MNELGESKSQHAMLSSVYASPLTASVVSKLVAQPANISSSGIRDAKAGAEASRGELTNASFEIQKSITDASNAVDLFPDIELSKQTLISSIIAPNNMVNEDYNLKIDHPNLPNDVSADIIRVVRPEIDGFHEVKTKIFKTLENALFIKGSHVELVLPESAVDHLINERPGIRFENVNSVREAVNLMSSGGFGFLGPVDEKESLRFESFRSNPGESLRMTPVDSEGQAILEGLTVSDDFGILKNSVILRDVGQQAARNAIRKFRTENHKRTENMETGQQMRMESFNTRGITTAELKSSMYKSAPAASDLFLRIPDRDNLRRHSIGRPLRLVPPSECFLPVHYPGDPERHIGAFALVDQDGYFLSIESNRKHMITAQSHLNQVVTNASGTPNGKNANINSSLLEKAKNNLRGTDNTQPLTYLAEIFGTLLEDDLLKRIKKGIYSTEAAIAKNNEIYSVMLARSLAGSQTQIVFIPKEFFTYFAFQFNRNGTGRSLLDDVSYLISLRAVSLYAKVANQIRNAISITDVNLELDPRDATPQRTIEKVVDLTSQTRTQFFPWGLNTPSDIANWWHRAGMQLHVTGHPGIPATKISYEHRQHDKSVPNLDDDGALNDMIHMRFGITPEMRDANLGAQFATSIANGSILFSKRVTQLQAIANTLFSDHIQVIVNNDSFIFNQIRRLISQNWGNIVSGLDKRLQAFAENDQESAIDSFTDEVISSIKFELPSPGMTTLDNQLEAFNKYKEAVDATFEYVLSSDSVSQAVFGESADALVEMATPLKAHVFREWMRKNNFLIELLEMAEVDEEGKPKAEATKMTKDYLKNLANNLTSFMREFIPIAAATTTDVNAVKNPEANETDDSDAGVI